MDKHIDQKSVKKSKIFTILCCLVAIVLLTYFTKIDNIAVSQIESYIVTKPASVAAILDHPGQNTVSQIQDTNSVSIIKSTSIEKYQINNQCQFFLADIGSPSHNTIQNFSLNVVLNLRDLNKNAFQNNALPISVSSQMYQDIEAKIFKRAFYMEIQKFENDHILNPSFAQEFTNNLFYTSVSTSEDPMVERYIQDYNLTAPTMPSEEQLQNDPDCHALKLAMDSMKKSN